MGGWRDVGSRGLSPADAARGSRDGTRGVAVANRPARAHDGLRASRARARRTAVLDHATHARVVLGPSGRTGIPAPPFRRGEGGGCACRADPVGGRSLRAAQRSSSLKNRLKTVIYRDYITV